MRWSFSAGSASGRPRVRQGSPIRGLQHSFPAFSNEAGSTGHRLQGSRRADSAPWPDEAPEALLAKAKILDKLKSGKSAGEARQAVLDKYPKAAIQLGSVRGVVLLVAHHTQIKVCEIKPTEVKSALTGNGRASKQQVGRMTKKILNIKEAISSSHASDALALAITGLSRNGHFRW